MIHKPQTSNIRQQPSIYMQKQEVIEEKEENNSSSVPRTESYQDRLSESNRSLQNNFKLAQGLTFTGTNLELIEE
jgi:hypothetical protein